MNGIKHCTYINARLGPLNARFFECGDSNNIVQSLNRDVAIDFEM